MPASMTTRPGQTQVPFEIYANAAAGQQNSQISVQFGQTTVQTTIAVAPQNAPVLTVPAIANAIFGQAMQFTISAADSASLPVVLSAGSLPSGAAFDPGTGEFSWTPAESQQGEYHVTFTATDSSAAASSGTVTIEVGSGAPVITSVVNAASQTAQSACGPNAIASLEGRWLAQAGAPVTDPSGGSTQLGGAKVNINGSYVPVVYASQTRIDFLCPASASGTALNITVENASGTSAAVQTVMNPVAVGLYSLDGSGNNQGLVTLSGTSLVAMSRNYLTTGQPAEPGDAIAIQATGIDLSSWKSLMLKIGSLIAQITGVTEVPGTPGVYQITATVPYGIGEGDSIPVSLVITPLNGVTARRDGAADSLVENRVALPRVPRGPVLHGNAFQTNTVTIAVEASSK